MGAMKNQLIFIAECAEKETGLPIEDVFEVIEEMFRSGFVNYRTWNGDVKDVVHYVNSKAN